MKLSELLAKLPIGFLVRIAINCGIVCGTHSKRQLIQAIQDNFRRREFLNHVIQRWQEQERATLAFLLLSLPVSDGKDPGAVRLNRFPVDYPENGGMLKRHIQLFCSHGFLLPANGRESDESQWVIPEDLRENLQDLLLGNENVSGEFSLPDKPNRLLQGGKRLLEDLFTLLVFARKEGLRLKRSGTLFKRSLDSLYEYFLVEKDEYLIGIPGHLPDRLAFMIYFSKKQQILLESDGELQVTRNLEPWMLKSDLEKIQDLYQHFRRFYVGRDPSMTQMLSYLEKQIASSRWIPLAEPLMICYGNFKGDAWWREVLLSRAYWMLHLMMSLDLIELGQFGKSATLAYRWLPLGEFIVQGKTPAPELVQETRLAVQPDFEVFVSHQIGLDFRWKLECMADLISRDVVFRYRISRDSVYRGLKWGVTAEEMLAFLSSHSERPLPQNVVFSLETWGRQYGNISFADVMLMRLESDEVAQEMQVLPEITPLIRGAITPRDLIISRQDYEHILRILERNGYLPKPGIITFEGESAEAAKKQK